MSISVSSFRTSVTKYMPKQHCLLSFVAKADKHSMALPGCLWLIYQAEVELLCFYGPDGLLGCCQEDCTGADR